MQTRARLLEFRGNEIRLVFVKLIGAFGQIWTPNSVIFKRLNPGECKWTLLID